MKDGFSSEESEKFNEILDAYNSGDFTTSQGLYATLDISERKRFTEYKDLEPKAEPVVAGFKKDKEKSRSQIKPTISLKDVTQSNLHPKYKKGKGCQLS